MTLGPASRPCGSCPYRRDVPSGVWEPVEYAKLPAYDRPTGEQPAAMFLCHQQDGRVCAGWAGCHDMDQALAMRLAGINGDMIPDEWNATLDYESPVPLFASGAEAAAHGLRDVTRPDEKACRTIDRLTRKRART